MHPMPRLTAAKRNPGAHGVELLLQPFLQRRALTDVLRWCAHAGRATDVTAAHTRPAERAPAADSVPSPVPGVRRDATDARVVRACV